MVVDRLKLTVFYLKSFDMDSVQVGKAVYSVLILYDIDQFGWFPDPSDQNELYHTPSYPKI